MPHAVVTAIERTSIASASQQREQAAGQWLAAAAAACCALCVICPLLSPSLTRLQRSEMHSSLRIMISNEIDECVADETDAVVEDDAVARGEQSAGESSEPRWS